MINERGLTWRRYGQYWMWGLLATAVVMALCLLVDPSDPNRVAFGWPDSSIFLGRLSRVGTAALVGAALAASGVLLQALLRNPLADPYVLGISTGSSVGVMVWVVSFAAVLQAVARHQVPAWVGILVTNGEAIPALIGALISCVAVFAIARASSTDTIEPLTLLLVGVVVSAFNGALVIGLDCIRPNGATSDVIRYLIGYIDWTPPLQLYLGLGVFVVGWASGIWAAGAMNIASLSDTEAKSLGLSLGRVRMVCFVAASVMTAAAIALARAIGFVGLICPHVCRMLFGPDQRQLMVTAPFCGAVFLMLADALVQVSRPMFPNTLPVGVITALAGGPFFLILLRRQRGGM